MMQRRGLTLIEVLAATVLISLIAVTCLPVMQQAAVTLRETAGGVTARELALLADTWLEEATPDFSDRNQSCRSSLPWPDDPMRLPVEAELITTADPDADHAWLTFTYGDLTIVRWIPLEKKNGLKEAVEP
jgi:prepilin-type N-terminal cleavage/methylation domain-containing protein